MLVSVPEIFDWFDNPPPPLKPDPDGADQLNVVPAGITPLIPFVGGAVKVTPPQLVAVISVTAATGLIVTTSVKVFPFPQSAVIGVTIYVAVMAILDVCDNVPEIFVPVPLTPPVKPEPVGANQLNVVPVGITPLVPFAGVTVKVAPVHTLVVIAVIAGVGFTTIVNVCTIPLQVLETGVTVIRAVTGVDSGLTAVNALILPVPAPTRPIEVRLLVQLYTVPATGEPVNTTALVNVPLHTI